MPRSNEEKEKRRKNRRLDVDPPGPEIAVPTEKLKAEERGERWAGGGSAKEFVSIGEGRRGVKDVTDPSFRLQQANLARQREGLSPLTSEELLRKEEGATDAQIELEGRREGEIAFLKEKGFFEETRPEEVSLAPDEKTGAEALPVFGPSIAALRGEGKQDIATIGPDGGVEFHPSVERLLSDELMEESTLNLFRNFYKDRGQNLEESALTPLIANPETARELAKQAIQQEVIDEGLSKGEEFGAMVEAIPVAGPLIGTYAGAMIEDPAGNVDTIVSEVNAMGSRATNMREKALTGKMGDPYLAFEQMDDMEFDLVRLEQRIKLLIINSAELQADADQINRIEESILDARQRIFDAKQSAAVGIIKPATDADLFLELRNIGKSLE